MFLIFSSPMLIRHLWQLKTVVFMHRSLIPSVLLLDNKHLCLYLASIIIYKPPYGNFKIIYEVGCLSTQDMLKSTEYSLDKAPLPQILISRSS